MQKQRNFSTGISLLCICRTGRKQGGEAVPPAASTPRNCGKWTAWLLPRPLGRRVGVDGRRCRVVRGNRRVGVGRVRRRGVLRHDVRPTLGRGGGRGGGRGRVEVERGGGRRRSRRPLQDDVRVELRLGAVESGQGGLQQTLLTPGRKKEGGVSADRAQGERLVVAHLSNPPPAVCGPQPIGSN